MLNIGMLYKLKTSIVLWDNCAKETQKGILSVSESFVILEKENDFCVMLTSRGIFKSSRMLHLINHSAFFEKIG